MLTIVNDPLRDATFKCRYNAFRFQMSLPWTVLMTGNHRLATATTFHATLLNLTMLETIAKQASQS